MVSIMLAELLVGMYKKFWTDLLPSNTATKAQKVEVNESDSLCHQNSVRCTKWRKDLQLQGRAREKRTRKNQGGTTFYDYLLKIFKALILS